MVDRAALEIKPEFDFGAWEVGAMRFKGRQLTQMSNGEIMIDMGHHKHELSQVDVSNEDKLKPERLLTTQEMSRYRGGFGSIGWSVHHHQPQRSFDLSERRRRQHDATVQEVLKLNTMIRVAKSIKCKLKVPIIPVEQLKFRRGARCTRTWKVELHNKLMCSWLFSKT